VKIGFVGLGKMGRPMAMNLVKSGAELVVHATADESYPEFRAAGARATYDLSDVAEAPTIFLSLPGSDAVKGLLETLGNQVLYMGPVGSGQLTKLVNQLLFDINCAALAEILPMAAKMGLDSAKVGAIVNSGTGRSYASEFFIPRILGGQFDEGYPMRDAYKDLVSAAEFGAALCIPMPVLAAATATYQTALLQGHGAKGKGGMVRVFEDLLDVRFRQTEPTHKTP
jgi:3-hydroxyisobutyrate dehydrogenase-like beta-hydroxyacid dehydrogenase